MALRLASRRLASGEKNRAATDSWIHCGGCLNADNLTGSSTCTASLAGTLRYISAAVFAVKSAA